MTDGSGKLVGNLTLKRLSETTWKQYREQAKSVMKPAAFGEKYLIGTDAYLPAKRKQRRLKPGNNMENNGLKAKQSLISGYFQQFPTEAALVLDTFPGR